MKRRRVQAPGSTQGWTGLRDRHDGVPPRPWLPLTPPEGQIGIEAGLALTPGGELVHLLSRGCGRLTLRYCMTPPVRSG